MSLPFEEETYSVSRLLKDVSDLLKEALPHVWVAGEVQRARRSQRGHLYFELVEKGRDDRIVGKLEAVIWRSDLRWIERELARSGQEIADGLEMRCAGTFDVWPPGGRLQLMVQRVDPVFALGLLAQRRQAVLESLTRRGLLERNRSLELAPVPLAVALVTSQDSAAYHDFLSTLAESGYGFRVLFLHAAVQGHEAEREVVSALETAYGARVDCIALVRGGGSRADLAAFDSAAIAEAVARAPMPVLTGLGHEIDEAIADLVAHTALKTPTKVGELLVERVTRADADVAEKAKRLRRAASEPLERARRALSRAERGVEVVRLRLAGTAARLSHLEAALGREAARSLRAARRRRLETARRLRRHAPRVLDRQRDRAPELARRIAGVARARLREADLETRARQRMIRQLSPRRTLERGFSITRDSSGAVLRDPSTVAAGERLTTELAAGRVTSRVEER